MAKKSIVPIINVSNVLKYAPMSKNTVKNKSRLELLSEIAYEQNTDVDRLVWYFAK